MHGVSRGWGANFREEADIAVNTKQEDIAELRGESEDGVVRCKIPSPRFLSLLFLLASNMLRGSFRRM